MAWEWSRTALVLTPPPGRPPAVPSTTTTPAASSMYYTTRGEDDHAGNRLLATPRTGPPAPAAKAQPPATRLSPRCCRPLSNAHQGPPPYPAVDARRSGVRAGHRHFMGAGELGDDAHGTALLPQSLDPARASPAVPQAAAREEGGRRGLRLHAVIAPRVAREAGDRDTRGFRTSIFLRHPQISFHHKNLNPGKTHIHVCCQKNFSMELVCVC